MPQVLVHFDEATLQAIDRVAPAVKDTLFLRETERMREAYPLQPDTAEAAEAWQLPE